MPSLDSVTFDLEGLQLQEDGQYRRVWLTAQGDGLLLHYFPIPPDIQATLDSPEAIASFYGRLAVQQGLGLVEAEKLIVDECTAVRVIFKIPHRPHGLIYVGSITLPFRDFSFLVKVESPEHGISGMREALVTEQLLRTGEVTIDDAEKLADWSEDIFGSTDHPPLGRNRSDREEYDALIPDHPLSRARLVLTRIQSTLRVGASLKREPGFRPHGSDRAHDP